MYRIMLIIRHIHELIMVLVSTVITLKEVAPHIISIEICSNGTHVLDKLCAVVDPLMDSQRLEAFKLRA